MTPPPHTPPRSLTIWTRDWARGMIDLCFPPACALCSNPLENAGDLVCPKCAGRLWFAPEWHCPRCGSPGAGSPPETGRCRLCPPDDGALQGVIGVVGYNDVSARLVHGFKYNRRVELGGMIGNLMLRQLEAPLQVLAGRIHRIAPVPLHPLRRWIRGFNQSELLAEKLTGVMGAPVDTKLLRRTRYTRPQVCMPRDRRAGNVKGAFAVMKKLDPHREGILLVDDVATTGSTLNECAAALLEAGAREVWAVCYARRGLPDPANLRGDSI